MREYFQRFSKYIENSTTLQFRNGSHFPGVELAHDELVKAKTLQSDPLKLMEPIRDVMLANLANPTANPHLHWILFQPPFKLVF